MSAAPDTIAIQVNGTERHVPRGLSVAELLAHLGVQAGSVGVERAGGINKLEALCFGIGSSQLPQTLRTCSRL